MIDLILSSQQPFTFLYSPFNKEKPILKVNIDGKTEIIDKRIEKTNENTYQIKYEVYNKRLNKEIKFIEYIKIFDIRENINLRKTFEKKWNCS